MVVVDRSNLPDYEQLVKFLFQPFLTATEALRVDCEYTLDRRRVLIRVAVADSDQGTAFGRGGRNIQAIRTVLQAVTVDRSIHLDVYGSNSGQRERDSERSISDGDRSNARNDRPAGSRPARSMPTRRQPNGGDSSAGGGDRPTIPPPQPRR